MKYTILPPGPVPTILSGNPKIRSLGEHQRAFMNANNPQGFLQEVSTPEATHAPVLTVDSTSYEISRVLKKAALEPGSIDTLATGLPHRLLMRLRVIEAAVIRHQQYKARIAAKKAKEAAIKAKAHQRLLEKQQKAKAEKLHIKQVRNYKAALNPNRQRYDPLKEIYRKVHGPKKPKEYELYKLTPREEYEVAMARLRSKHQRITSPAPAFEPRPSTWVRDNGVLRPETGEEYLTRIKEETRIKREILQEKNRAWSQFQLDFVGPPSPFLTISQATVYQEQMFVMTRLSLMETEVGMPTYQPKSDLFGRGYNPYLGALGDGWQNL